MTDIPLLSVENLSVAYREGDAIARVTHEVSFTIAAGEVVALVGESGSGKTTTAQAVIGLLPENGRVESGSIRLNGEDIARWSGKRLDAIRGKQISLIPQDPTSSLNPVKTVGAQVGEILRIHGERDRKAIEARVVELLARVGLSSPELRARQYPHELSGGMKQRVLIAIAIALKPQLIIADEPTSALDVTVQRRILDLIDDLRRENGTAVLLVTHDLGVAADRADRIVVLQGGRIQETDETARLLAAPRSAYAQRLLADAPSLAAGSFRGLPAPGEDAIVVENLVHDFSGEHRKTFRAVDGVSFVVRRGTTHAIVGESGSGKTTTVRDVVGFGRPTGGAIRIEGTDIGALKGEALRRFRQTIQLVYQNPYSSLDPRQTVFSIVEEPLINFGERDARVRTDKVNALLERVGLPEALHKRRPRALSGGQRQRVAIARALILDPKVLVLDEAVSALDVTVQAQILKLLDELQRERGLTYLFVSHDLAVVRQISDTVSVLHNGRQVESGRVEDVFLRPQSDYTRELIDAIPGKGATPLPNSHLPKRLGFFTRLLEDASPADRYRFAGEQIVHAEANGFDSAWIAQHHFHREEGGLPSPLVLLSYVAALTTRIRLGTGIITLPLENPIRAAEDAAVLDLLSGGRLELGLGSGGTPASFTAFGYDVADKASIYEKHLQTFRTALSGSPIVGDTRQYPPAPHLLERFWQATFSAGGGARAGKAGDGLMLSRTQPRPADNPQASLPDLQHPIIDAYVANLPREIAPRIVASRTLFVADSREEARRYAATGLRKAAIGLARGGHRFESDDLDHLIAATDTHVGTVDDVLESLTRDTTLQRVTDIVFQVHSVDPPHELTLRSIELIAAHVAPQLGWTRSEKPAPRLSVVR